MRIMLVGGTGTVGTVLNPALSSRGHAVLVASRRTDPLLDVEDVPALGGLLDACDPDLVVYLAGVTDRAACQATPELAWRVCALGCRAVGSWCAARQRRCLLVSCAEVFGTGIGPHPESEDPDPTGPYAASVFLAEREILAVAGGLVVRTDFLGGGGDPWLALARRLRGGDEVTVSGRTTRSPLHVEDVAAHVRDLVDGGVEGLVHVGGNRSISEADFAAAAEDRFGKGTVRIAQDVDPDRDYRLASTRDPSLTVWRRRDLSDTLTAVLDAVAAESAP
jgi:dTDP-4-dehydrorhamnose reductase